MGGMRSIALLRGLMARLPLPLAVGAGFGAFVGVSLLFAVFMPPPRDLHAECRKQCEPRLSRLVPDKNYPMSTKGTTKQLCECY